MTCVSLREGGTHLIQNYLIYVFFFLVDFVFLQCIYFFWLWEINRSWLSHEMVIVPTKERQEIWETSRLCVRTLKSSSVLQIAIIIIIMWLLTLKRRVAEGSSTHSSSKIPSAVSILFLVFSLRLIVLYIGSGVQRWKDQTMVSLVIHTQTQLQPL